jgi:hypothetical protein
MGRGGRRAGAGRKPKPIATLLQANTWRPDRHGPRPAAVAPAFNAPPPPAPDWTPAADDVATLGPVAQAWLAATLDLYSLNALEGQQLLSALRSLNRVEALEATIAASGITASTHAALVREQRVFVMLWTQLRFVTPESGR